MDRDSMVELYFRLGMSYKDILKSLALQGIVLSERHLNRILRARSLHRRRYDLDPVLYQTILDYKTEGRYLPYITKKEKNEFRRKASKFTLEGELWMS